MGAQLCRRGRAARRGTLCADRTCGGDSGAGARSYDFWRERDFGVLTARPKARMASQPWAASVAERGGGAGFFRA